MSQMTKYEKDIIRREADILADQIRDEWANWMDDLENYPRLREITTAASLAHHGILDSVDDMVLENVDLTSVPVKHLASLASCVTQCVEIINISNVIIILDSVNCETLSISRQSLSSEETLALVQAMESRVERVNLGVWQNDLPSQLCLDIRALNQYSGQGRCHKVIY